MRTAFAVARFHFLPERAAITVGVEDANDARNTRLDGPTPRITGSRHRAHCGAVIRAVARDDLVAACKELRHLHGIFVGFCTAQREERFRQASDLRELLAEQAAGLRGEAGSSEAE